MYMILFLVPFEWLKARTSERNNTKQNKIAKEKKRARKRKHRTGDQTE